MLKLIVLLTAFGFSPAGAYAGLITLTFDEQPSNPPVNGLSQSGVTFGFTEDGSPSTNATYSVPIDGVVNMTSNVMDGPARGTLTLTFGAPTPYLHFDVALGVIDSLSPGFTVQLLGSGAVTPSTAVDTDPIDFFSEGSFTFDSSVAGSGDLISQAVVTFNTPAGDGTRFALDNLTFDVPESVSTPEPLIFSLVGSGLLLFGGLLRRSCSLR